MFNDGIISKKIIIKIEYKLSGVLGILIIVLKD